MENETWKAIELNSITILVSNFGIIKNKSGRILAKQINNCGYVRVCVGKRQYLVHRLVLLAHVGPCPSGHQGAHGDGNKLNNELSNLRWATVEENARDRSRHGHSGKGCPRPVKLSQEIADEIRASHLSSLVLAAKYDCHFTTIARVKRGLGWAKSDV